MRLTGAREGAGAHPAPAAPAGGIDWPEISFGPVHLGTVAPAWWFYSTAPERLLWSALWREAGGNE